MQITIRAAWWVNHNGEFVVDGRSGSDDSAQADQVGCYAAEMGHGTVAASGFIDFDVTVPTPKNVRVGNEDS